MSVRISDWTDAVAGQSKGPHSGPRREPLGRPRSGERSRRRPAPVPPLNQSSSEQLKSSQRGLLEQGHVGDLEDPKRGAAPPHDGLARDMQAAAAERLSLAIRAPQSQGQASPSTRATPSISPALFPEILSRLFPLDSPVR